MQSDVNVPVAFHGIGSICDEVLVESVKAVVVEYCCQPFSLIVKCAYSELSWFLFCDVWFKNLSYKRVLYVISKRLYYERFSRV